MPLCAGEPRVASRPARCAVATSPIGIALSGPKASWRGSAANGGPSTTTAMVTRASLGTMYGLTTAPATPIRPRICSLSGVCARCDLGLRVHLRLMGSRESCDAFSGEIEEGSVDTRALACVAMGGGGRPSTCSPDELRFLDDNLPAWDGKPGDVRRVAPR